MKVSRQFAPMSLEIETKEDLACLLEILAYAEAAISGAYGGFFVPKDKKELHEDLIYIRNKLKGN